MLDLFAVAGIVPVSAPVVALPAALVSPAPAQPQAPRPLDAYVPAPEEMRDPAYSALSCALRGWTITLPGSRIASYAHATHIRRLLLALHAEGLAGGEEAPARAQAVPLLRQMLNLVDAGHVALRSELGVMARQEWAEWQEAARTALGMGLSDA